MSTHSRDGETSASWRRFYERFEIGDTISHATAKLPVSRAAALLAPAPQGFNFYAEVGSSKLFVVERGAG